MISFNSDNFAVSMYDAHFMEKETGLKMLHSKDIQLVKGQSELEPNCMAAESMLLIANLYRFLRCRPPVQGQLSGAISPNAMTAHVCQGKQNPLEEETATSYKIANLDHQFNKH